MQEEKGKHLHPQPLVGRFAHKAVGHQKQQRQRHGRVDADFHFHDWFHTVILAVGDHPVQVIRIVKDHISATVVVVDTLGVEEGIIGCLDPQHTVNVRVSPTGGLVGRMEVS